ncbi:MAG: DUF1232 domain-containing protein [Alphaproteobacteria bacterium]
MGTPYRYPSSVRIEKLEAELMEMGRVAAAAGEARRDVLALISDCVEKTAADERLQGKQIRRWLWVASQYRMYADYSAEVAAVAGGALLFLSKCLETRADFPADEVNWVLAQATERLSAEIGAVSDLNFLSESEIDRIEEALSRHLDASVYDLDHLRTQIQDQMSHLSRARDDSFLRSIEQKIDYLFETAQTPDASKRRTALAALLYLAEEQDVVPDDLGILGLLDDLYVVEWAYATVRGETGWLSILESKLAQWPFVETIFFRDEAGDFDIGRYGQHVISAGLSSLFEKGNEPVLVLREAGPLPILLAFYAAIHLLREASSTQPPEYAAGQSIFVGDEVDRFKAIYLQPAELGRRRRHRVQVAQRGSIHLHDDTLRYNSTAANTPHKSLSKGNEIQSWEKNRRPSVLAHELGRSRYVRPNSAIFLLTQRNRLDHFIREMEPLGHKATALINFVRVDDVGKVSPMGTSTSAPLIYCCADSSAVVDLVRNPPDGIASWSIVCDGARTSFDLVSALTSENLVAPFCVVAELKDREAIQQLQREANLDIRFLEETDVDVPFPPASSAAASTKFSTIRRFFERQGLFTLAKEEVHLVPNRSLEKLFNRMEEFRQEGKFAPEVQSLLAEVWALAKKMLSSPVAADGHIDGAEEDVARIRSFCKSLAPYTPLAKEFDEILGENDLLHRGKDGIIRRLIENAPARGVSAVLCSTHRAARTYQKLAEVGDAPSNTKWLSLDEVRLNAPLERLIVPGWIDRNTARDLYYNRYASHLDFVFFPFEQRWNERAIGAAERWAHRLLEQTERQLSKAASAAAHTRRGKKTLWQKKPPRRRERGQTIAEGVSENDVPILDVLEARTIEAVREHAARSGGVERQNVEAELVILERGCFTFLFPNGEVIDLSGFDEAENGLGSASLRKVRDLAQGARLAFPKSGTRDLIDLKADAFLPDPVGTRALSSLWKRALNRCLERDSSLPKQLSIHLAENGEGRTEGTIRLWAQDNTGTIAPRNWKRVIPLLSDFLNDAELKDNHENVLSAVDLMYRARSDAARSLIQDFATGEFDLFGDSIALRIGEATAVYGLHRVVAMGGIHRVSLDRVGLVQRLSDTPPTQEDHPLQ